MKRAWLVGDSLSRGLLGRYATKAVLVISYAFVHALEFLHAGFNVRNTGHDRSQESRRLPCSPIALIPGVIVMRHQRLPKEGYITIHKFKNAEKLLMINSTYCAHNLALTAGRLMTSTCVSPPLASATQTKPASPSALSIVQALFHAFIVVPPLLLDRTCAPDPGLRPRDTRGAAQACTFRAWAWAMGAGTARFRRRRRKKATRC